MLPKFARALKSAAARPLGPDGDHTEKSGVEFITRSDGRRGTTADDVLEEDGAVAVSVVDGAGGSDKSDGEDDGGARDDGEPEEDNVRVFRSSP